MVENDSTGFYGREGELIMEFKEVVKNRYSCKKYSERKVEREKLKDILEAGRLAPTVLVVAFDRNNVFTYPGGKRDSGVEDAAIIATHIMLAAEDVGVNSCWLNYFDPDKLADELGLPDNEEILMLLDLGYGAEGTGPLANHNSRKELDETVSYI